MRRLPPRRPPARLRIAICAVLAFAAPLPATAGTGSAPVEVTRFHTPATIAAMGRGAVAVVPAPGSEGSALENAVWLEAVQRELSALGFGGATPGAADLVAEVRIERQTQHEERRRGPVSVGVGGSTGGWNSGVGLGVGFNLGHGARDTVWMRLAVTIREKATGKSLWEGRAETTERVRSKSAGASAAGADLASARLAHALFAGFPGTSGATITVK